VPSACAVRSKRSRWFIALSRYFVQSPGDEDPKASCASRTATRLGRAPQDAVRRWVYRPTRLGGEPVDLITSIYIVFRPIPD